MAAGIVSEFLNNKTPLAKSISEVASLSRLNTDQVKRVVELTNQLTYLKLLETSSSRTFEFPLADFEEVMALIMTPESGDMSKQASLSSTSKKSPLEIVSTINAPSLEKVASEEGSAGFLKRASKQEKLALLNKEYYRSKGELEKLAGEESRIIDAMYSAGRAVKDDPEILEKVACVTEGNSSMLVKVSNFLFDEVRATTGEELFYEADIEEATKLVDLLKEASEIVEEKKILSTSLDKAKEYLQKEAMFGKVVEGFNKLRQGTSAAKNTTGKAVAEAGKSKTKGGITVLGERAVGRVDKVITVSDRIAQKKPDVYKSNQAKLPHYGF